MFQAPSQIADLRVLLLLLVFAVASYSDWKVREVRDEVWLVGALLGGAALLYSDGLADPVTVGLDLLVIMFVAQHFVAWDAKFSSTSLAVPLLEGALYLTVIGVAIASWLYLQPVPGADFFAVVIVVVIARALFETGLLYGGADAKALMAAAILLPVFPVTLVSGLPATLQNPLLAYLPFALTMLVNGAVLTLVAPLVVLVHNLRKGEHRLPHILHLYKIRTEELPHRFVWLKDPAPEPHGREETTEEDEELRSRQARDLLAKGVKEVWVTPQVPFLISLTGGAVLGLFIGNVLLVLIAYL